MSARFRHVPLLPMLIMASDRIHIFSANMRGLRQHFKRVDLSDFLRKLKADIICLQETHLVQKDLNTLLKEWNIEYFIAGNSTNSVGVTIMVNNTFEYSVKRCIKDPEGRYVILNLSIVNFINVFIINV